MMVVVMLWYMAVVLVSLVADVGGLIVFGGCMYGGICGAGGGV